MIARFSAVLMFLRIPKRVGRVLALASAATIVLFAALVPQPVAALEILQSIGQILGAIISFFVWIVGKLLILAIYLLTTIAQYNDFINAPPIVKGWVIVRDVANMFFIVVLLVIAFATILNISSYKYQQMLPKLLIAAILINFSRTICGIFIDLSQVVMLTFVNGFAAAAAGNFSSMFQMNEMFKIEPTETVKQDGVQMMMIVGGYLLALLMSLIALATVVVFIAILSFRIVMLWALVVLSPLPYLLRVMENRTKKYGEDWWNEFFKYLIVGPVLAFFLWLSLVTMGSGNGAEEANIGKIDESSAELQSKGFNEIGTKAGNANNMLSFIISIAMLMAGLKVTSELGVAGSSMAGAVKNKVGEYGKTALKKGAYYGSGAAAARSVGARVGQSKAMQGALATASRIPLVGNFAVSGLMASQAARKKREEAAAARVDALKKTGKYPAIADRARQRWYQAPGRVFAGGYYEAEAAKKLAPSSIRNPAARRQFVQGMKGEDMKNLSAGELRRNVGDMNDAQRLQVLQSGTSDQQQAVGLPAGYRSYQEWYNEQVEAEAAPLRAGGMNSKQADREAKRNLRTSGRDVPTAPALATGLGTPGYMPGYTAANIDTKYAAEYDKDRQQRTGAQVAAHAARGEDFFASQEFSQGGDQYYAQDVYEENEETAASLRRHKEERGESGVSGVRKTRQRYQQAFGEGGTRKLPRVMLAANFADLGMEGMGAHLTGDTKVEVAGKIDAVMQREGYTDEERGDVRGAVVRADSLDLINSGREAGSAKYAITHERTHGELERVDQANPGALQNIWKSMPNTGGIVEQVRKEWKDPNMSEEGAMHEYFTDGLSNATQFSRAGGFTLPPDVLAQFKALGVKMSVRPEGAEAPLTPAAAAPAPAQEPAQPAAAAPPELAAATQVATQELGKAKDDDLDKMWDEFPPVQQDEIVAAIKAGEQQSAGIMRQFLAQALARSAAGSASGTFALPQAVLAQLRLLGVKMDNVKNAVKKRPPKQV